MRHFYCGRRFNRTSEHRSAMLANLALSLLTHEQLVTTLPKAKELRPFVEKLITVAKRHDSVHCRRIAFASLRNKEAVRKLFTVLAPRYGERDGGYLRVSKVGFRTGDSAPLGVVEFVDRDQSARGASCIMPERLETSTT